MRRYFCEKNFIRRFPLLTHSLITVVYKIFINCTSFSHSSSSNRCIRCEWFRKFFWFLNIFGQFVHRTVTLFDECINCRCFCRCLSDRNVRVQSAHSMLSLGMCTRRWCEAIELTRLNSASQSSHWNGPSCAIVWTNRRWLRRASIVLKQLKHCEHWCGRWLEWTNWMCRLNECSEVNWRSHVSQMNGSSDDAILRNNLC
jgi:hypothetical protein